MKVTRIHPITGQENTLDLDITEDQLARHTAGFELIQDVMPQLSSDEREFLISGLLPGEFDKLYEDDGEFESDDDEPVF